MLLLHTYTAHDSVCACDNVRAFVWAGGAGSAGVIYIFFYKSVYVYV